MKPTVIAIDGTAASGKGTLARRLARELDFAFLDTGKLYRLVGYRVLQEGDDPADEAAARAMAEKLKDLISHADLDDPALGGDDAGQAASKVAAHPGVRSTLISLQKNFALAPPDGKKGAILDGRDIGTVICPDADVKFYIDADTAIRAQRRHKELHSKGISVTYDAVLADMRERDARDAGRAAAPMKAADDAVVIDTSEMDIETAYKALLSVVQQKIAL